MPANPLAVEPSVGDASTTSASIPPREQTIEPSSADAGIAPRRPTEPALPRWVPANAPLTVVQAADRDRNLGLTPPAPPSRITVDAGGVEVDIEVRRPP